MFIRVKDKKGAGHHYSIAETAFDPEMHERLKSPGEDDFGRPIPPKFHVAKDGSPATARSAGADSAAATDDGTPVASTEEGSK